MEAGMASKRLTFKKTVHGMAGVRDLYSRFMPGGKYALNRTEWRGHPPRSCAITRLSGGGTGSGGDIGEATAQIEVTYRPKGHITYTGKTRYDAWTAMLPKNPGKKLKDGEKPE